MIQITPQIIITADHYQYKVGRPRKRSDKSDTTTIQKPLYHTTLASAVKSAIAFALRDGVADGTITTLREFVREQKRLHMELEVLINPLDC